MERKKAIVAGGGGLVGSTLLPLLLASPAYGNVTLLLRRERPITHPKLVQRIIDFERLEEEVPGFPAEDVFCCLGTTIKKAKTKGAFRRVDHDYPLSLARLAARHRADKFLVVTAIGADPRSLFLYNRVKGELEETLKQLDLPSLHLFRPSLLLGDREEKRAGEVAAATVMPRLSFLLRGPLKKYRPVWAQTVAAAMFQAAQEEGRGTVVHESDGIERMGTEPGKRERKIIGS